MSSLQIKKRFKPSLKYGKKHFIFSIAKRIRSVISVKKKNTLFIVKQRLSVELRDKRYLRCFKKLFDREKVWLFRAYVKRLKQEQKLFIKREKKSLRWHNLDVFNNTKIFVDDWISWVIELTDIFLLYIYKVILQYNWKISRKIAYLLNKANKIFGEMDLRPIIVNFFNKGVKIDDVVNQLSNTISASVRGIISNVFLYRSNMINLNKRVYNKKLKIWFKSWKLSRKWKRIHFRAKNKIAFIPFVRDRGRIGVLSFKRRKSNIFFSLKDLNFKTIVCKTAGMVGVTGTKRRKRTPQAFEQIVKSVFPYSRLYKLRFVHIYVYRRPNIYYYTLIRLLNHFGIRIKLLVVRRYVAHNGCKGKKLRRV